MSTQTIHRTTSHHPRVLRGARGWLWVCDCGSASCRTPAQAPLPWRSALIGALLHSSTIAP
ncbi:MULTISPECIES: hypothetical protein [unclassified Phycicoccus]|uniref:hypothetical protein n=1 Tax=unclassified Phycicoccus TaxID=2637926 RepID=UPI0007029A23|nr:MULTISPECIES: hypothetical protein [unclassified Phycicoccus]KRF24926.1 hypothetical protein ASG95_10735 [Phycicoccus sp. Soil803]KRF29919.1 hypothetical protein ASG91_02745 [Phycicoccus sp. Soil802]